MVSFEGVTVQHPASNSKFFQPIFEFSQPFFHENNVHKTGF